MSFESSHYRESRILPENMEHDLRVWANGTVGWFLLAIAMFGWLSLLSWSSQDMQLGIATRDLRNLFGPPGAVFSDFFMSSLGLSSMFLFLPLLVWGWKIKNDIPIHNFKQRLALLPVSVLLIAGAAGGVPTAGQWPLTQGYGGIFGDLIFGVTNNFIASFKPGFADIVATLILASFGLTAFLSSMELTFQDVAEAFKFRRTKFVALRQIITIPGRIIMAGLKGGAVTLKILGDTFTRQTVAQNYSSEGSPTFDPEIVYVPHGEKAPLSDGNTAYAAPSIDPATALTEEEPHQDRDPWGNDGDPDFDEEEASRLIAQRFAPRSTNRAEPIERSPHQTAAAPSSVKVKKAGFFAARNGTPRSRPGRYQRPDMDMLKQAGRTQPRVDLSESVLRGSAGLLQDVLGDFGVDGKIIDIKPGPVVTLFEFEPARGVKSSRVIALADDIARSMSAVSARVAVVPGRNVIGIELPNMQRDVVLLSELLGADTYTKAEYALPLALGKDIAGAPVVVDLARMPHLLIAGTTGSGKSVGINAMILSLLYALSPEQCKFIMIDPKMLELSVYNDIPHLLAPVVTDPRKAVGTLDWVIREMEERYKNMSQMGVRSIGAYNQAVHEARAQGRKIVRKVQTGYHPESGEAIVEEQIFEPVALPFIVVVIDELADLMMVAGKEIEASLQRLAQMARAAGIHLILATQRPSVDVLTGTIKANFPTRISFKVASKIDSRTILSEPGAEQLLGHGDMLYSTGPGQMNRIHGPLVEDSEVEKIIGFLRRQGRPNYVEALSAPPETPPASASTGHGDDANALYERAVAIVLRDQKVSTSYVQRRLSIGYNRAADLIDRMEGEGLISPANRTGKRQILMGESTKLA